MGFKTNCSVGEKTLAALMWVRNWGTGMGWAGGFWTLQAMLNAPEGGLVLPMPTVGGGRGLGGEMLLSQGWGSGGTDGVSDLCSAFSVYRKEEEEGKRCPI